MAALVNVNPKTVAYYFDRLCSLIADHIQQEASQAWSGEVEVGENYFGGHRKSNRGSGVARKVPVFVLLKRGGKVFTQVIPDVKSATLIPIIEKKVIPDSIVYSDC